MLIKHEEVERYTIVGALTVCLLSLIAAIVISVNDETNMFSRFMPIFYLIFGLVQCGLFNGIIKLIRMSYAATDNKTSKLLFVISGSAVTVTLCLITALAYVYAMAIILKL